MTYENIKSIILTILVVTSAVLTWNLWTYQPNYATMENSNTVQEVVLSEQRELEELIQPDKIIYHVKDSHFGTTNNDEINEALKEVTSWNFYDIENITEDINLLPNFVHSKGNIEIIFPDAVPIELYKNVIHIEDNKVPKFQFNRIVIDVDNNTKDVGNIYFVQYGNGKEQKVYAAHIKVEELNKFEHRFYRVANQLEPYFAYEVTESRTIFLPENKTKMIHAQYFLDQLDPEQFKDALFNDPSYVQRNDEDHIVEYIDDSSMLTVNNESLLLSYVNPAEARDQIGSESNLLKNSIDFVNEHGGWTGLFRYSSMNEDNQEVSFRLYDRSGFPIFNEKGLSQIVQVWGENDIYKYNSPVFSLDIPLTTEKMEMNLPSGSEVIEFLKEKRGFKPELLKDIVIGYKMIRNSDEPQLIELEPSWYYHYGNSWVQIEPEELGGKTHGLE